MTTPDKACPFCGSVDLRKLGYSRTEATHCRGCGAVGPPRQIGQEGGPDWNTRAGDAPAGEPVAWLHTLHMEGGQTTSRVTCIADHNWGKPGIHFDASYTVTSEPLYPRGRS